MDITPQEAIRHERASTLVISKLKVSSPDDLSWRYKWYVVIDEPPLLPNSSLDERLERTIINVFVSLEGRMCRRRHARKLSTVPERVVDFYRKIFNAAIEDERRVAAMTDEEREREAQKILCELSGQSGFISISGRS